MAPIALQATHTCLAPEVTWRARSTGNPQIARGDGELHRAAVQPARLAFISRNFPVEQQGLPTVIYLSGMSFGPVDRAKNFDVAFAFAGGSLLIAAGAFLVLVRERDVDMPRAEFRE